MSAILSRLQCVKSYICAHNFLSSNSRSRIRNKIFIVWLRFPCASFDWNILHNELNSSDICENASWHWVTIGSYYSPSNVQRQTLKLTNNGPVKWRTGSQPAILSETLLQHPLKLFYRITMDVNQGLTHNLFANLAQCKFHGIPWDCSWQWNWHTSNFMEFHGIPWNCSCQQNWHTPSSMDFHGTARVSEIGPI